ncbi:tRNA (N6-threonylcarbamoyladenosine(37)-N6)-methyltransferase TrmO [Gammaproteobacteria bacterium]|nr:tRNA (N6-threonylcarbamoyladenosine(37)-N6)-methyltransferase TrmO [Gammaproteobacteria bacterium]
MNLSPIAYITSPYKQKFAIPRQPNLVKEAKGEIVFEKDFSDPNCLRDIEQFSHLWLIFVFHETQDKGWSPTVQPPRLGGKENVGVFATRSTFRPNPLGMSVVENLGWEQLGSSLILKIGGLDLLDGTPILDIKPYLPYADALPDAKAGFAESIPGSQYEIVFSAEAEHELNKLQQDYPELKAFISSVLQQDPRPAWRKKEIDEKRYGMNLYDLNIKWQIQGNQIHVISINPES